MWGAVSETVTVTPLPPAAVLLMQPLQQLLELHVVCKAHVRQRHTAYMQVSAVNVPGCGVDVNFGVEQLCDVR